MNMRKNQINSDFGPHQADKPSLKVTITTTDQNEDWKMGGSSNDEDDNQIDDEMEKQYLEIYNKMIKSKVN